MNIIHHLSQRLESRLPGQEAQYEMAPSGRAEFARSVTQYKQAAVLCLFYPKSSDWHMVFIKRSAHEKDKHSSQIAFPGGKREQSDKDYRHTALREAQEELGIISQNVQVIGDLTPLKIPVSQYEVFPVLGFSDHEPDFILQESEVEEVIEVPIEQITDPSSRKTQVIELSTGLKLPDVPIFEFGKRIVWGATSMILNEVVHLLKE